MIVVRFSNVLKNGGNRNQNMNHASFLFSRGGLIVMKSISVMCKQHQHTNKQIMRRIKIKRKTTIFHTMPYFINSNKSIKTFGTVSYTGKQINPTVELFKIIGTVGKTHSGAGGKFIVSLFIC